VKDQWISVPAPGSFWSDLVTGRIVCITGLHVDFSRYGHKPTVLVQYRKGSKAWEVGSCNLKLWTDEFTDAQWEDWLEQEDTRHVS
jgi:hypothetical protein